MSLVVRFSEQEGLDERGIQAWIILIGKARNRQTVTYLELSRMMLGEKATSFGNRAAQWKGMSLGYIYTYCKEKNLPLLPVIVVAKETGEPATEAIYEKRPVGVERERVFDFDWYDLRPPTKIDLRPELGSLHTL